MLFLILTLPMIGHSSSVIMNSFDQSRFWALDQYCIQTLKSGINLYQNQCRPDLKLLEKKMHWVNLWVKFSNNQLMNTSEFNIPAFLHWDCDRIFVRLSFFVCALYLRSSGVLSKLAVRRKSCNKKY